MYHGIPTREEDGSSVIPLRGRSQPDIQTPPVDLNDLNSPHTLATLSVPSGATVLDVGCGTGIVARALAARGCKVWGVELDARRASSARSHCVDVLEADIESTHLASAFGGQMFDAVLYLDVLEHLRDPGAALGRALEVLAPGGSVLISIPNVTHGALRLELLRGRFRYRGTGLLDRGHLRFFDGVGVTEMVRQAGFCAETMLRVLRPLDQTEFDIDWSTVPSDLRTTLERDIDALTYQFFVVARPARGLQAVTAGMSLLERQRLRSEELAAEIEKGAAYARHLEGEIAAKDGRMRELEAQLVRVREVEQTIADLVRASEDTNGYVRHLEGELRKRAGEIAIRDDEMSVLRTDLERTRRALSDRERQVAESQAGLTRDRIRASELERRLDEQEAKLRDAVSTVEEGRRLITHLGWVLQQPRHRLAASCATALTQRMPWLQRLLRPLVLRAVAHLPNPCHPPSATD